MYFAMYESRGAPSAYTIRSAHYFGLTFLRALISLAVTTYMTDREFHRPCHRIRTVAHVARVTYSVL